MAPFFKGRQTIQLGEDVFVDVDPKDEYVKVRMGNEKGSVVKKVDLWAAIFSIADSATQEKMMPIRQTQVESFERIHRVRVTKALKPGDEIRVKCHVSVEKTVIEGLAGNLTKKTTGGTGGILIPKQ